MSLIAVEHAFTGPTTPVTSYDSTKTNLGSLIQRRTGSTGSSPLNFFAGPIPIGLARPMESNISIAMFYPHVIPKNSYLDRVFLIENSVTSSVTRRIFYYEYNRLNSTFTWNGAITFNLPGVAATHTCATFRAIIDINTTGTAYCGGTGPGIDGAGTQWLTDRIAGGARIGFGTQDPTQIANWYYLQPTGPAPSDTSWTLTQTGPNTSVTGPYVIEELRFVYISRGVTTNGGLFFLKGLNLDYFGPTGPNPFMGIATGPTGPSGDNRRAVYWLKDAATVTMQNVVGCGLLDRTDWQNHDLYVINSPAAGWVNAYRYNLRAALSPAGNIDTGNALVSVTATGPVSGTIQNVNSVRYANAQHGPGANIPSVYFVTSTRIYRCPVSSLGVTGSNTFIADSQPEYPPGVGSTGPTGPTGPTFPLSAGMSSIEYVSSIDRFAITTDTINRAYITRYRSTGPTGPYPDNIYPKSFDHPMFLELKQLDQSLADTAIYPITTYNATAMSLWGEKGLLYVCRNGTTIALNQIYAIPIGADWSYAGGTGPTGPNGPTGPGEPEYPGSTGPTGPIGPPQPQRLITPGLDTPNATSLIRVYCNYLNTISNASPDLYQSDILGCRGIKDNRNLSPITESFRIYARTSGISDNTGSWTALDYSGNLTGLSVTGTIQLMIEFRIISPSMIPTGIFSITVLYENNSTDSHYELSATISDLANKRFAWWFRSPFNSPVPNLRVQLFNATGPTGPVLIDDNTSGPTGTFEQSIDDGSNWIAWSHTDRQNSTTYLRYTPVSLADDIPVMALLMRL